MPKISYAETLETNPNTKAVAIKGGAFALLKEVRTEKLVSCAEVGANVLGEPHDPKSEEQIKVGRAIAAILGDIIGQEVKRQDTWGAAGKLGCEQELLDLWYGESGLGCN